MHFKRKHRCLSLILSESNTFVFYITCIESWCIIWPSSYCNRNCNGHFRVADLPGKKPLPYYHSGLVPLVLLHKPLACRWICWQRAKSAGLKPRMSTTGPAWCCTCWPKFKSADEKSWTLTTTGTWSSKNSLRFAKHPSAPKSCVVSVISSLLDMKNLQEQVKKAFCYQKFFWSFTVWINYSIDLKNFINSWPSASNF